MQKAATKQLIDTINNLFIFYLFQTRILLNVQRTIEKLNRDYFLLERIN